MITPTKLIKDSLYFSALKHDGQYRKGGNVPYVVHPVLVAFGILKYSEDEEVVAACLLHDVLEDCLNVSESEIEEKFGKRVAGLVKEVSFLEKNSDLDLSWREKKAGYLNQIKNISKDALLIVAVDKMGNLESYFSAVEAKNPVVKTAFRGSFEDYVWYYTQIKNILSESLGGNHQIVLDYEKKLDQNIKYGS